MSVASLHARASVQPLRTFRTRALPGGRAWCLIEGRSLAEDPEFAEQLSAALRPIAANVFPHAGARFLDLVSGPERLASRTGVAVLRAPSGQIGGMVSYVSGEWGGERCFYAASAFICPSQQGSGLVAAGYGMLMRAELLRAPLRPMYAVVRTPNPVVYAAWRHGGRKVGSDVQPTVGLHVSEVSRRVALATAAANGFGERVDPRTLIVRGAYDGGIVPGGVGPYGVRPQSGDAELDALFDRLLGPEDALLVVGRMTLHRAAASAGDRAIRRRLGLVGGRRRGAITAPTAAPVVVGVAGHGRVRGPERRGEDRRGADRRAGDRRGVDRRRPGGPGAGQPWAGPERRRGDRRELERREAPRRQGPRRAGPDRRS